MLLVIWLILYANWIVRWYFDWTSTEHVDREWKNLQSDNNNNNDDGLPEHREKKAACVVRNNPLLTLIFHRRLILRLCAHQFGLLRFFFSLCVCVYHITIFQSQQPIDSYVSIKIYIFHYLNGICSIGEGKFASQSKENTELCVIRSVSVRWKIILTARKQTIITTCFAFTMPFLSNNGYRHELCYD